MELIKYHEKLIAFDFENEMINASDVLKAFPGKRMNNFLRMQSTKDFISVLDKKLNTPNSAIKVSKGRYGGTYMNRLLAYKFAAWLNPAFEVFVYSIFDNYVQKEITRLNNKLSTQQRELDYFWDK